MMTPAQQTTVLSRMIFLRSLPYSGSTLLALLLNLHPDVVSVGEMNGLPSSLDATTYHCSCGYRLPEDPFWQAVTHGMHERGFADFSLQNFHTHFEAHRPIAMRWMHSHRFPIMLEGLRDKVMAQLPGWSRHIQHILKHNVALADTIMAITNSRYFFDSSKEHQRLPSILQYGSGDFRVIYLVRDILGWAASYRKHSAVLSLEAIARRWIAINRMNLRYLQQLPSDRYLIVHYHDIVAQPVATLDRLCDFIGVRRFHFPDRAAFDAALDAYEAEHHVIGNVMRKQARQGVPFVLHADTRWKETFSADEMNLLLEKTAAMRETADLKSTTSPIGG